MSSLSSNSKLDLPYQASGAALLQTKFWICAAKIKLQQVNNNKNINDTREVRGLCQMVKASEKYPCLKKIKKNQLNIIRFPFFYNARADKLYLKIIDNLKKKSWNQIDQIAEIRNLWLIIVITFRLYLVSELRINHGKFSRYLYYWYEFFLTLYIWLAKISCTVSHCQKTIVWFFCIKSNSTTFKI